MISLYHKYKNILLFLSDKQYRNYKLVDKELSDKEFVDNIIKNEYIKITCKDKSDNTIYCYLLPNNSKYLEIEYVTKLFNSLNKESTYGTKVIMITKYDLNKHIKKNYVNYNNLTIYNFPHKYFIVPINKGPLCAKYRILSKDEAEELLNNLMKINRYELRKIRVDDPQMIWIDANVGDIVECEDISFYSAFSCKYELVIFDPATLIDIKQSTETD